MYILKVQRRSRSLQFGTKGELWVSDSKGKEFQFHSFTREPGKVYRPDTFENCRLQAGPAYQYGKSYHLGFLNTEQIPDEYYRPGMKPKETGYLFEILFKDRDDCFIVEGDLHNRFLFPILEIIPPTQDSLRDISSPVDHDSIKIGDDYVSVWETVIGTAGSDLKRDWRIRFHDEPDETMSLSVG